MTITIKEFTPRPARRAMTQDDLQAQFNRVKNVHDWKNPINRLVIVKNQAEIEEIAQAIVYFTGSVPQYWVLEEADNRIKVRFQAGGYHHAIGM